MPRTKLFIALSFGLLASACANPYDRQAAVPGPAPVGMTASESNCIDYGFVAGSASYARCVDRESRMRSQGRVTREYTQARLTEDARDACYSYGLEPGSLRFNSCVSREVDSRAYRDGAYVVTTTNVPVYRPAPPPEAYVDTRVQTTGVPVSRDEYGFRYDDQGNRVDAQGRIISPQSTRP